VLVVLLAHGTEGFTIFTQFYFCIYIKQHLLGSHIQNLIFIALANEFRPDHPTSISTQLPKLNLLAQSINRIPLPPIPTQCYSGVLLPSKRYQLTARTFDVVTSAQTAQRMVQAVPTASKQTKVSSNSNNQSSRRGSSTNSSSKKSTTKKVKPSYGAARGRQISINLKGDDKKAMDVVKSE
jgi:hypothetical protein